MYIYFGCSGVVGSLPFSIVGCAELLQQMLCCKILLILAYLALCLYIYWMNLYQIVFKMAFHIILLFGF